MNKLFILGAALLALVGCDKSAEQKEQTVAQAQPAGVPQQDGQYLRFYQLSSGETRLEAHQVSGKVRTVISGKPGFAVEPGEFPDVSPLRVRIKDCGLITFTKASGNPQAMTAERTETQGLNAQCPIQKLDGLWVKLSANA